MLLENRRTLSNYNIQEDTEISLPDEATTFLIQIYFPTGDTIRFLLGGIDTIGDLKSRIQARADVPRGKGAEFNGKTIADHFSA